MQMNRLSKQDLSPKTFVLIFQIVHKSSYWAQPLIRAPFLLPLLKEQHNPTGMHFFMGTTHI